MALRDLRVEMRDIIEARQRSNDDPVAPYLDMKAGEVVQAIDEEIGGEPDDVQALLESDPERLVFIQREEGSEGWQRMSVAGAAKIVAWTMTALEVMGLMLTSPGGRRTVGALSGRGRECVEIREPFGVPHGTA